MVLDNPCYPSSSSFHDFINLCLHRLRPHLHQHLLHQAQVGQHTNLHLHPTPNQPIDLRRHLLQPTPNQPTSTPQRQLTGDTDLTRN